jgi:hypothetical protein
MEIRTEPDNLQINDNTITLCPCCNFVVIKEIKKGKYLTRECSDCIKGTRPFSYSSGDCSCKYGEKDYIYITCETCKSPKCINCKKILFCCNNNCGSVICNICIKKTEFNNKWKTTTPQEKLNLYGIEKLKVLAKNKKLKGYSKYKKNELINILSSLVNETDFPIKPEYCF